MNIFDCFSDMATAIETMIAIEKTKSSMGLNAQLARHPAVWKLSMRLNQ
jgi:hypothetical protein